MCKLTLDPRVTIGETDMVATLSLNEQRPTRSKIETYGPSTAVVDRPRISGEIFRDDSHVVTAVLLYHDSGGKADDACMDSYSRGME